MGRQDGHFNLLSYRPSDTYLMNFKSNQRVDNKNWKLRAQWSSPRLPSVLSLRIFVLSYFFTTINNFSNLENSNWDSIRSVTSHIISVKLDVCNTLHGQLDSCGAHRSTASTTQRSEALPTNVRKVKGRSEVLWEGLTRRSTMERRPGNGSPAQRTKKASKQATASVSR